MVDGSPVPVCLLEPLECFCKLDEYPFCQKAACPELKNPACHIIHRGALKATIIFGNPIIDTIPSRYRPGGPGRILETMFLNTCEKKTNKQKEGRGKKQRRWQPLRKILA